MLVGKTNGFFSVSGTRRDSGRPRDMAAHMSWKAAPADGGDCIITTSMKEIDLDALSSGSSMLNAQSHVNAFSSYRDDGVSVVAGRSLLHGVGAEDADAIDELIGLVGARSKGIDVHACDDGTFRSAWGEFPFAGRVPNNGSWIRIVGEISWGAMSHEEGDRDARTVMVRSEGVFKKRMRLPLGGPYAHCRDFVGGLASGNCTTQRSILDEIESRWRKEGIELELHSLPV